MNAVVPPFTEDTDGLWLSEFRATLDAFTEGNLVSVAENPFFKPSDAFLARVHPVEEQFFDIRSIAPFPGIRALGGFAEFDTFVVLTWNYRENIREFSEEVMRCKGAWYRLFTEPPFNGATLNEYLSNFHAV